jgi:hypothetical protein
MGAYDRAVREQCGEIGRVRCRHPRRHRPRRLSRILRLDAEQRTDDIGGRRYVRFDQVLRPQAPAGEVKVSNHW